MKKLFTICFLLVSLESFCQCSKVKDSFTGKETTSYVIKIGGMLNIGDNITFAKEGDHKVIVYTWMIQGVTDYERKIEDCSLLVKLDDGEALKFLPSKDSKINNSNGYLIYVLIADLTEEEIQKFKTKNVEAVRFALKDDQGIDVNLTKKNLKEFKSAAICVE